MFEHRSSLHTQNLAFLPNSPLSERLDGPHTGEDFLGWRPVAVSPSGTVAQFNLGGVAGLLAGWEKGVEVNVIGLVFAVNPKRLSLNLPLIGNVGDRANAKPRRIEAPATIASPWSQYDVRI